MQDISNHIHTKVTASLVAIMSASALAFATLHWRALRSAGKRVGIVSETVVRGFPRSMERYVAEFSKRTMSTTAPLSAAATPDNSAAEAAAAVDTEAAAQPNAASPPKHSVVYTKTGDKGTSALFTGERRKKTDPVFEALGALDELNSHVGLARAMLRSSPEKREHDGEMMMLLENIQQELLNAGTVVATPTGKNAEDETAKRMTDILEGYRFPGKTSEMEKVIDVMDSRLVPLRVFILPGGGNVTSAQLHVCRTVCRRAERRMIEVRDLYGEGYSDHLRQATVYVNRLSDFLFVAARIVAEEDIVRKYD
jgi:cob(I)alamin adenosyltransferase